MEKNFVISKSKKRFINFFHSLTGKKIFSKKLSFEIHLTDGCNLNCKGCFHYSPLSEKNDIYPLAEYENDMNWLGKIFRGKARWVHILGGEPLLNENIIKYLEIARKSFPKAKIDIVTNGTLLFKKSDDFFDVCRKNDIGIAVTIYPINFDYENLENFVKSKNCKITMFGDRTKTTSMMHSALRINGNFNYSENFYKCNYSGNCANLRHGKLYICANSAYIDILNKYFNLNFNQELAGIDIYKHNRKQIINFMNKPNQFCKYCDLEYRKTNRSKWSVSKKQIEERLLDK